MILLPLLCPREKNRRRIVFSSFLDCVNLGAIKEECGKEERSELFSSITAIKDVGTGKKEDSPPPSIRCFVCGRKADGGKSPSLFLDVINQGAIN
jgi:hypothetical protein